MLQTIHCNQCGGSSIGLESVSVNVVLSKYHHCDKCHHGHDEKQTYFFCSELCFHNYLLRVVDGEAKLEFKIYDQVFGQSVQET